MERKISPFEKKDIKDYNKASTLMDLRANCARAVELDDNQGGKKQATYLLAMRDVADAIYTELGVKAEQADEGTPVEDTEEYKELVEELESFDAIVASKDAEIESLKEQLAKAIKPAAKKTTAKKTTAKKGAK